MRDRDRVCYIVKHIGDLRKNGFGPFTDAFLAEMFEIAVVGDFFDSTPLSEYTLDDITDASLAQILRNMLYVQFRLRLESGEGLFAVPEETLGRQLCQAMYGQDPFDEEWMNETAHSYHCQPCPLYDDGGTVTVFEPRRWDF